MKLTECLRRFFGYYLTGIKGVSPNTIQAYRKTFELFLPFAAKYRSRSVRTVRVEDLSTELVVEFLVDLERTRNNSVRTRNLRLGTLKSWPK